jgi:glutamine synthetase
MAEANAIVDELRNRGIKRAKVGGFDIDGVLRGKYMSLDKLAGALDGGFGFCDVIFGWDIADNLYDEASVTGWDRGFPDASAILDPGTLRDLPWEPGVALMLADFRDDDGGPHPACPRSLLKTQIDKAKGMGFSATFACEYEFFFFRETPDTLDDKKFVGLEPLTPGMFGYSVMRTGQNRELMAAILDGMERFDVEIEGLHTETGPGVYEAAIRYDDVLRAADKAALFKVGMKQIAREHGLAVTFMAKWNAGLPGCSGHLHQSLHKDGENAFYLKDGMSDALRHYVGGLVRLMPDITAMVSPTINSYKRYVPGVWAPLSASWGKDNRTAGVRLIGLDSPKGARIEFRQTAADLNPYTAMAACLGAGLHGIESGLEPPKETRGDATYAGTPLPKSLGEAAERLDQSELARKIYGDAFVSHYVHTRRWEVREYERAVTDWELRRYFEAT